VIEEINKGENIGKWTKGQRINWLGHLDRMEEDRMPQKMFTQELEGTRRRGRSRKKMERGSRKRSSSAGSEKMESVGGADRKKWKDIVRQAKAHSGL